MSTSTQPRTYMRLQDRAGILPEQRACNVALLRKIWRHTDPQPHCIRGVCIQGTPEALSIECFGAGGIVPLSHSAAKASAIFATNPASREVMSFQVELNYGYMVSSFQGNVNLGLLVLAGFHDFKDGSARSNCFSREFFYASGSPRTQKSTLVDPTHADGSRILDNSSFVGSWHNTNSASLGIVAIEIRDDGEKLGIRAFSIGELGVADWGETQGSVYAKDCSSSEAMAFSAVFHFVEMRCHLQANIKQGVLVVAYFTEFRDGSGRSNYFSREFYYKEL